MLLAPAAALFATFVVFPLFETMRISLYEWDGIGPKKWIGLDNYRLLFSDPVFFIALRNNALWLLFYSFAPILGLAFALLLNQSIAGIRVIRSLFFVPFVISQVVIGLIFAWFFHSEFGLFNEVLRLLSLGPVAPLSSEQWATPAIIIAGLWPQTAYCMILYLTALATIRGDLVDAARVDGARAWNLMRFVVLPQLRPITFVVAMVCIVAALRSFDLVMIMTGGGPYDRSTVLALYMYEQTFSAFRFGYAAAIATVLLLLMGSGVGFFLWRLLRRERY